MTDKILKVLVVDDSALFRKLITDVLERDPGIEVVGTADNGRSAIVKNEALNPDVITMDIEMPVMDGFEALKAIIDSRPKPVIMMSVFTQHGAEETFKALEYGAVDFIPKPSSLQPMTADDIADLLIQKVKSVAGYTMKARRAERIVRPQAAGAVPLSARLRTDSARNLVAIGTSTGGPSALMSVFQNLPQDFSLPIVVVQHMPPGFTRAFAERLNQHSPVRVKEAEDGDIIVPGCAYVAPGNLHMAIGEASGKKIVRIYEGDKVSGHRPSIDVLFHSVAEQCGKQAIAVIMTGMGKDGARGIRAIRDRGGYTIAQDEETSVVFGMNRVAAEMGGIHEIVPLDEIPKKIVAQLG